MSYLHDPSNSRHARVFELLHQTQQASHIIERIKITTLENVDEQVVDKLREAAIGSLRPKAFTGKRN